MVRHLRASRNGHGSENIVGRPRVSARDVEAPGSFGGGTRRLYLLLCIIFAAVGLGVVRTYKLTWLDTLSTASRLHGMLNLGLLPPSRASLTLLLPSRALGSAAAATAPPPLQPPQQRGEEEGGAAAFTRSFALPPLEQSARGRVGEGFSEPAERFPGWWAWSPQAQRDRHAAELGSDAYQCLALNSEFSPPEVVTAALGGGRLQRTLRYGHWRMRWPRFARGEHLDWFNEQDLVAWRSAAHPCVSLYDARRALAQDTVFARPGGLEAPALDDLPPASAAPTFLEEGQQRGFAIRPAFATPPGAAGWSEDARAVQPPLPGGWAAPPDTSALWLYFCEPRYTEGRVVVTDGARVSEFPGGHDCGPDASVETLFSNAATAFPVIEGGLLGLHERAPDAQVPGPLFWGVIPATWTWQHWCENTLPKMAQVEASVVWEEVWGKGNGPPLGSSGGGARGPPPRLLGSGGEGGGGGHTPPPHPLWSGASAIQELLDDRFPIVSRIYSHALNMTPLDERQRAINTPRLLHACAAPPMHPFLWQLGQSNVFRTPPPPPLAKRTKLVYCSRRDASTTEHPGRLLLNEEAVVALLGEECRAAREGRGSACQGVVTYNHKAFNNNLSAMVEFFSDAIGLISPHGGCLTNVNLLPCNAGVLEIMPLQPDKKPTEPHWHVRPPGLPPRGARARTSAACHAHHPPRPPPPAPPRTAHPHLSSLTHPSPLSSFHLHSDAIHAIHFPGAPLLDAPRASRRGHQG